MAPRDKELGAFLRAHHARVNPEDVGLAGGVSGRRVAGLRREEVAVLAARHPVCAGRVARARRHRPPHRGLAVTTVIHSVG